MEAYNGLQLQRNQLSLISKGTGMHMVHVNAGRCTRIHIDKNRLGNKNRKRVLVYKDPEKQNVSD